MAVILNKKEQGFTRYVCDAVPVHTASLGDTAIDKATGIEYTYLSSGWVNSTIAEINQSQKIYVDSTYGVDSTGKGSIASPYLTPEFALSDITNTGTVTANISNTSNTISNISDVDNTTLKVGMYVVGTGIPYGTVIVSKGNEGGNLNTISISKHATATTVGATVTWVQSYTLVLNGDFYATSNWHKEGFSFECGDSIISFENLLLFYWATARTIPIFINGGSWYGRHTGSKFIYGRGSSSVGISVNINNYYSIGTGYQIDLDNAKVFDNFYMECDYFDARFGSIMRVFGGNIVWKGDCYGLLGGFYVDAGNSNNYDFTMNGNVETPSTVTAITQARGMKMNFTGKIKGSVSLGDCVVNGNIIGTSHTIGTSIYSYPTSINGTISGALTLSGDGVISINGSMLGAVTQTGGRSMISNILGAYTASGSSYADLYSSSRQGNQYLSSINLSGTAICILNSYRVPTSGSTVCNMNIGSGTTFINKAKGFIGWLNSDLVGTFKNYADMKFATISNGGVRAITGEMYSFNSEIEITTGTGESANNTPTINISTGKVVVEGGSVICNLATSKSGLFRKTADTGKLIFKGQPYLKVANGLAPLQILSNVGTAQDVVNFGVITNGAVGFRLADTFSDVTYGTAYAPNILVGGTTYEDTTYDF